MTRSGLGVRVTLLCEDRAHDGFIRGLLSAALPHEVNVLKYPRGLGSGKAFVDAQIAVEYKVHARRATHQRVCLIVVTDEDNQSIGERRERLFELAELNGPSEEFLVMLIPKWEIETWFLVLRDLRDGRIDDASWTEDERFSYQAKDIPPKSAAEVFLDVVHRRLSSDSLHTRFPSLVAGIEEYRRFQK